MSLLISEEGTFVQEKSTYELTEVVRLFPVPIHVAIAMDGNRRWAGKRFLPAFVGHWRGADVITKIVSSCSKIGIKVLTLYAFSTENWSRSENEVNELFKVFAYYLKKNLNFMIQEGVRLNCIGDLTRLPKKLQTEIEYAKQQTQHGEVIDLVLAINYGGRDEIRRAITSIVNDCEKGLLKKEDISEDLISKYLDTARWNDPDLFIRTSGEQRLSNFLLWQFSYTEVYITKTLWPDFDEKDLFQAVIEYQKRERRLGGV
ncbi:MAG: isoprenyl transferase [Chlamydiae bacterium]|nr:isoprenyl transferase [Chlamydiota bacterium]